MEEKTISEKFENLVDTFIFFGNPKAPYWLVGLEESADPSGNCKALEEFVQHTISRSEEFSSAIAGLSLRDLCGQCPESVQGKSIFLPNAELLAKGGYSVKLQRTWMGYIKLLHAIWNKHPSGQELPWKLSDIRDYQAHHLGELNGDRSKPQTCLMELYPLPYNRRKKWVFSPLAEKYTSLDFLRSEQSYRKYTLDRRISLLNQAITKYKPEFLIFFGADCRRAVQDLKLDSESIHTVNNGKKDKNVKLGYIGASCILFCDHPGSYPTNVYWKNLGALCQKQVKYPKAA